MTDKQYVEADERINETADRIAELGFEEDEFGHFTAADCRITVYRAGQGWKMNIKLPNGSAVGIHIPLEVLWWGRTAAEIAAAKKR
jgi:hypothetical protein